MQRYHGFAIILTLLVVSLLAACSVPGVRVQPEARRDGTVEAQVADAGIDATVQARLTATALARPRPDVTPSPAQETSAPAAPPSNGSPVPPTTQPTEESTRAPVPPPPAATEAAVEDTAIAAPAAAGATGAPNAADGARLLALGAKPNLSVLAGGGWREAPLDIASACGRSGRVDLDATGTA